MLDLPVTADQSAERAPRDAVAEVAAESALEWAFRRVEQLAEEATGQTADAEGGPPAGAEARGRAEDGPDRGGPVTGETAGAGTATEAENAGQGAMDGGAASSEEERRVNRVVIPVVDSSRLRLADRYWLEQRIGRGETSDIWRAFDELLARPVSVLVMDRRIEIDSRLREALACEMRAAAGLRHPELVAVYDSGFAVGPNDTETPYIVMEPLEGETLAARLERGPLARREAVRVCAAVAAALSRAHGAGLAHRDVGTSHIFLTGEGVRLLGLGLGRALAAPDEGTGPGRRQGNNGSTLSAAKVADVRALGTVLIAALTGGSGTDVSDPSALSGDLAVLCRRLLGKQGSVRSAADAAGLLTAAFTAPSRGGGGTRGFTRSGMHGRIRRAGRGSRGETRDERGETRDETVVPRDLLAEGVPSRNVLSQDVTTEEKQTEGEPATGVPATGVAAADKPAFRAEEWPGAEEWRAAEQWRPEESPPEEPRSEESRSEESRPNDWRPKEWRAEGWRTEDLSAEARPAERPRRGRRRVIAAGLAVVLVSGLLIGVTQQNLGWPANLLSSPERKTPNTPVPTGQAEVPEPSPPEAPPDEGAQPSPTRPPAPPVERPGGDGRKTTAPPAPQPPQPPPPVADPKVIRTLENLRESVNRGLRFRQMRPDVAQDFNNVITNLRRDLESGRVKDPGPRAAEILNKIDTRVREGALDQERARRMRANLSPILPG